MNSNVIQFQDKWHGPCNFPIRVEVVNETIRYLNNDPDSTNFGAEVHACPGCGEQFYRYAGEGQSGFGFEHWNLVNEPTAK